MGTVGLHGKERCVVSAGGRITCADRLGHIRNGELQICCICISGHNNDGRPMASLTMEDLVARRESGIRLPHASGSFSVTPWHSLPLRFLGNS